MRFFASIIWIGFISLGLQANAQEGEYVVPDYKGMMESYFSLKDSTIRAEIGSFSFTGSMLGISGKAPLRQFELHSQTKYTITLAHDDKKVHVSKMPFYSSGHRFGFYGPQNHLYKIDGRYFCGFDGRMPTRRLVYIRVYIGEQQIDLPVRAFRDIYEPNFCSRQGLFGRWECNTKAFLSEDGERLYIYMKNSRIPSLYEVTWIIENGKYLGRVVDYAY